MRVCSQSRGLFLTSRRDKLVFPVKEAGAIKWAHKGGRFVVSLPSVIYNGKTQLTEPHRGNIITDFSYEVFKADKPELYYGTYRCIKKVTVDWDVLASFGQEVSTEFHARANLPSNEMMSLWHPSWTVSWSRKISPPQPSPHSFKICTRVAF